jgi:hypothetical protein
MEAPMRIVLFLLTAGAAAMGGAALAQSSTMSASRHAASAGWSRVQLPGRHRDFRRGPDRDHRQDGRHRGRFGRGDDRFDPAFGGIGFVDEFEAVDPHGNGFFAGRGGGQIRLRGGRPYYDYDRSYPYEWASAADGRVGWVIMGDDADRTPQCGVEHGVRVCRGRR